MSTPKDICPHCHSIQRPATDMKGRRTTEDRDSLIICGGCAGLIKREGRNQRKVTPDEIAEYERVAPASWARIVEVQELIRKQA